MSTVECDSFFFFFEKLNVIVSGGEYYPSDPYDEPILKIGLDELGPTQGLKFRRNFAEIRRKISFSLVTGKKIRYFSENFV